MQELLRSSREAKFQRKSWTDNFSILDVEYYFGPRPLYAVKMADREYNVYQAKLAEQAERYDGMK